MVDNVLSQNDLMRLGGHLCELVWVEQVMLREIRIVFVMGKGRIGIFLSTNRRRRNDEGDEACGNC